MEVFGIEDTDFNKSIEQRANAVAKRTKEIYDESPSVSQPLVYIQMGNFKPMTPQ